MHWRHGHTGTQNDRSTIELWANCETILWSIDNDDDVDEHWILFLQPRQRTQNEPFEMHSHTRNARELNTSRTRRRKYCSDRSHAYARWCLSIWNWLVTHRLRRTKINGTNNPFNRDGDARIYNFRECAFGSSIAIHFIRFRTYCDRTRSLTLALVLCELTHPRTAHMRTVRAHIRIKLEFIHSKCACGLHSFSFHLVRFILYLLWFCAPIPYAHRCALWKSWNANAWSSSIRQSAIIHRDFSLIVRWWWGNTHRRTQYWGFDQF